MSDKKKNKDKVEFDREAFKKGIAAVESGTWENPYAAIPMDKNGKLLSSAAGKYQFLWKNLKRDNPELLKGITKEDFLNNPELQEQVMDYAIDNKLRNYTGYIKNAIDLSKNYKSVLGDKWNYRPDEIAMLTHFLGRGGARKYLRAIASGNDYVPPGKNISVADYLNKYNKAIGKERGIPKKKLSEPKTRDLKLDALEASLLQPKDNINIQVPEFKDLSKNAYIDSNLHMPGHYEMPSANVGMNVIQNPQPAQTQPKEEEKTHWLQQSNDFLDQYLASNKFALGGNLTEPDPKKPKEKKQITSEEEKAIFDYITRQDMQSRSTGTMRPSDPKQGLIDKTIDVLASPLTSAKHLIKDGSIPDNMLRGERNVLDYPLDLINPFSYIDSGRNLVDATKEGDVIKGGLNLLGLIPMSKNIGKLKVKGQPLKKHWKDLKNEVEIEDYLKAEYERLNSPEGRKRLKKLGLDPEKTLEDFKNNLKFTQHEGVGSYYRAKDTFGDTDIINFDYNQFPELKEYNISPSGVAAHEIGHFLQNGRHRNIKNKEFINYLEAVKNKDAEALKSKYLYPGLIKEYIAEPTKIDDDLLSIVAKPNTNTVLDNSKAFDNYNYFKYGKEGLSGNAKLSVERLAFLRELRQQMIEGKYIKNAYDKIGKAELEKFLKENPKNRIASFLDNSPESKVKLLNNLKYLPAVGALTVGANKAKENNNKFSQGGNLNTNNMLNEDLLTEFNNGGSHEQNPLGGIPMGIGANGQPNLVEQGETREGDYVFSDRLVITKEIAEQFKLPKGTVGKTVAEASKKINDFSKESNSKIDKETTKENLERLKAANENLKKEKMFQEMDNFIGNEFEGGGFMDFVDSGKMGAATGAAEMIGGAIGGDTGNIIGGVAKGAQMGAALGPWGAAGGALIGGITSIFGNEKRQREKLNKTNNAARLSAAEVNSQFALGGKMYKLADGGNLYADGGNENDIRLQARTRNPLKTNNLVLNAINSGTFNDESFDFQKANQQRLLDLQKGGFPYSNDFVNNVVENTDKKVNFKKQQSINEAKKYSTSNNNNSDGEEEKEGFFSKAERGLRYSPALMNAIQLATMKEPEVESLDRIGTRFKPSYVDENQLINLINEQFGGLEGAIANASAGSTAAMRKNLLASRLNKTKAISDAFMKAEGANRQQDVMGQQFNLGVDKFNIGQSNKEKDWNARNRAMYDANKSRFMSAIGQDLGNIGLEAIRRRYPELMGMDYNTFGEFIKWKQKNKKG